ncbi:MAG: right-handed parallel beta-helix repeat-containing protein [Candidatus Thermoplasmatota archaeon]|nr:right-handed parallel beta-helix repeat-containing protein [Candidatus Thermoplasmatota archaeon]
MRIRSLSVVLLLVTGTLLAGLVVVPVNVSAGTLYVGGTGPGNYTSFQGAINVAIPGDTIYVYNGTYCGGLLVNKPLTLLGEGALTTTIDGCGAENVVSVTASDVKVMGFTITNNYSYDLPPGPIDPGIRLSGVTGCLISENVIASNEIGIYMTATKNCVISSNIFTGNKYGVTIRQRSNNNRIEGNSFSWSLIAIDMGDWPIENGPWSNSVIDNQISYSNTGILISERGSSEVRGNSISYNDYGIFVWWTYGVEIFENTVMFNGQGIGLANTDFVHVFDNNMIGNVVQAYDEGCYDYYYDWCYDWFYRNYWSDYTGVDGDGDGIGDTPYVISTDPDHPSEDPSPRMDPLLPPSPPSKPLNLRARGGADLVRLVWEPPVFDGGLEIEKYRVYRGATPYALSFIMETGILRYDDKGLTPGTYFYVVRAVNSAGEGEASNVAQAATGQVPGPPVYLNASLVGYKLGDVQVSWHLSADDLGGAQSVKSYEVYRSASFDPSGKDYTLIASKPRMSKWHLDPGTGEGNFSNVFYRVCAVTASNISSCAQEQPAKFTRPLLEGPNLLSIPLRQYDDSLDVVLQTVDFDRAWQFDPLQHQWKTYSRSKSYSSLNRIDHTMGVWVSVTGRSNFTVAGVIPVQTQIQLYEGWNLVGYPSFYPKYRISDLKATVPVDRVEAYDPSAPPNFLRPLTDADFMSPSQGYWVRASSDALWTLVSK